ncbi:MAG: nitrogen fixation protein NifE [Anaerofustis stercorihominis]|nr:nitrogen fixation protein NifE [Anaerofustis stercorihominis]
MGLHRFKPMPSGRMGIFWTLAPIKEAAVVEFGCMGHNIYSGAALRRGGIYEGYGSPLYTTYIDETDIAMGDSSRLAATIKQVIENDSPKAIFLQPSAVPEVVGTDMYAISNELQYDFPETILVPIGHGSFAISQHKGVQEALTALVKRLAKDDIEKTVKPTYNIIGSCPDLFNFGADTNEIIRMMKGAFDIECGCVLSSQASVTSIQNIGSAHVNLVIRREGIPAAKYLQKKFGTPYVYQRPYGIKGTTDWLINVGEALGKEPDKNFIAYEEKLVRDQIYQPRRTLENNQWSYPDEAVITIGGHYDVVKGIVNYATNELPFYKGKVWCNCPEMGDEEIPYFSEKEWIPVVKEHDKGYLMFSGEALKWAGQNTQLQIANPDIAYRLHPYDPPFVGYHGAVHLVNLWINDYTLKH